MNDNEALHPRINVFWEQVNRGQRVSLGPFLVYERYVYTGRKIKGQPELDRLLVIADVGKNNAEEFVAYDGKLASFEGILADYPIDWDKVGLPLVDRSIPTTSCQLGIVVRFFPELTSPKEVATLLDRILTAGLAAHGATRSTGHLLVSSAAVTSDARELRGDAPGA